MLICRAPLSCSLTTLICRALPCFPIKIICRALPCFPIQIICRALPCFPIKIICRALLFFRAHCCVPPPSFASVLCSLLRPSTLRFSLVFTAAFFHLRQFRYPRTGAVIPHYVITPFLIMSSRHASSYRHAIPHHVITPFLIIASASSASGTLVTGVVMLKIANGATEITVFWLLPGGISTELRNERINKVSIEAVDVPSSEIGSRKRQFRAVGSVARLGLRSRSSRIASNDGIDPYESYASGSVPSRLGSNCHDSHVESSCTSASRNTERSNLPALSNGTAMDRQGSSGVSLPSSSTAPQRLPPLDGRVRDQILHQ